MTNEETSTTTLDVLLVDDDIAPLTSLKMLLEGEGYNVFTASNGEDAIEIYERRLEEGTPIDIVLTDLNMPIKGGAEVTRRVKELSGSRLSRQTPVYVITGYEATRVYRELTGKLGEAKPDGIISKPFMFGENIGPLLKKAHERKVVEPVTYLT